MTAVIEVGELREIDAEEVRFLFHKSGNPIDEAFMIQKLMQNRTQHKVSKLLNLSQGQISKRLRLLGLHEVLQEHLKNGDLRASTAYALSKLSDEAQKEFLDKDRVTLKEVEAKLRQQAVNSEVMALIEQPMQNPTKYAVADSVEAKLNVLVSELEKDFGLSQDEALLQVKVCVDSWAEMRGLKK